MKGENRPSGPVPKDSTPIKTSGSDSTRHLRHICGCWTWEHPEDWAGICAPHDFWTVVDIHELRKAAARGARRVQMARVLRIGREQRAAYFAKRRGA